MIRISKKGKRILSFVFVLYTRSFKGTSKQKKQTLSLFISCQLWVEFEVVLLAHVEGLTVDHYSDHRTDI
jgi:hypothetical protein